MLGRLIWYAAGRPGHDELKQSYRAYGEGLYSDAAKWMQIALDKSQDNHSLRLRMSRWARYGLITLGQARSMLLNVVDNAPPPHARAASIELLNLCWEREGAAKAVTEIPRLARWLGTTPAAKLRLAALMHEAGMVRETSKLLSELATRHPRSLSEAGYLELVAFAHDAGFRPLPQAKTALALARKLDDGARHLKTLLSERDVAVVANGRSLQGRSLGKAIDAHQLVMRFNNYVSGTDINDLGQRTDIWVRPPHPRHVPWRKERDHTLLIFTGANLRHRFSNAIQMLSDCPAEYSHISTVPSSLYIKLFDELGASPSSGILGLALLAERRRGRVPAAQVYGYSLHENTESLSRYYASVVRGDRPSRHNWKAEQALFHNLIEAE
jgi:hypothetical protein